MNAIKNIIFGLSITMVLAIPVIAQPNSWVALSEVGQAWQRDPPRKDPEKPVEKDKDKREEPKKDKGDKKKPYF